MKNARTPERTRMSLTERAERRLRAIEERVRRHERTRLRPRRNEVRRVFTEWLDRHDIKSIMTGDIKYIESELDDDDEPCWEARVDGWRFYAEIDRDFDDEDDTDPPVVTVACAAGSPCHFSRVVSELDNDGLLIILARHARTCPAKTRNRY